MQVGIRILVSTVQCGNAIPVYKNMIWGDSGATVLMTFPAGASQDDTLSL